MTRVFLVTGNGNAASNYPAPSSRGGVPYFSNVIGRRCILHTNDGWSSHFPTAPHIGKRPLRGCFILFPYIENGRAFASKFFLYRTGKSPAPGASVNS